VLAAPHTLISDDASAGENTSGQAPVWEMSGTHLVGGGAVSPNPGPSWRVVGLR
jgi:hypothetical protein